eukprot:gnl/TRDRNA2_/TRDRNA2_166957_c0_seq1.p1 gnl/TRDRNA2_/TRDRNA2_166957_c0~~gnl/TRDRNA2_/TRDRNA2_166957_c0_seq1.p1  ORF type:complete len:379 (-),score=50.49 gnl/TRDRNA2_/TRDRNA2_166957_c0_seq1:59-1195(-)
MRRPLCEGEPCALLDAGRRCWYNAKIYGQQQGTSRGYQVKARSANGDKILSGIHVNFLQRRFSPGSSVDAYRTSELCWVAGTVATASQSVEGFRRYLDFQESSQLIDFLGASGSALMSELSPRKTSKKVREEEGPASLKIERQAASPSKDPEKPSPSESTSAKRVGMGGLKTLASPKLNDEYIIEVVAPAEGNTDVKEGRDRSIPFKRSLVPVLFDAEKSSVPEWVPSHLLRFRASVLEAAVAARELTEKQQKEQDHTLQNDILYDLQLQIDNAKILDWSCITEQEERLMSSLPQGCNSDYRVCYICSAGCAATRAVVSRDGSRCKVNDGPGPSQRETCTDSIFPTAPRAMSFGKISARQGPSAPHGIPVGLLKKQTL